MDNECELLVMLPTTRAAVVTQSIKFPLLRPWRLASHCFPKFNHHHYTEPESDEVKQRCALQRLKQMVQSCRKYDMNKVSVLAPLSPSPNVVDMCEGAIVWRHFPLKHYRRDCFPLIRNEYSVQLMSTRVAKKTCMQQNNSNSLKVNSPNAVRPIAENQLMFPISSVMSTQEFPISVMPKAIQDVHSQTTQTVQETAISMCNALGSYSREAKNNPLNSRILQKFPLLKSKNASNRFPCEQAEECPRRYAIKFPIVYLNPELHEQFPIKPAFVNKHKIIKLVPRAVINLLELKDLQRLKGSMASEGTFIFLSKFPLLKLTANATYFPLLNTSYKVIYPNSYSDKVLTRKFTTKFPINCDSRGLVEQASLQEYKLKRFPLKREIQCMSSQHTEKPKYLREFSKSILKISKPSLQMYNKSFCQILNRTLELPKKSSTSSNNNNFDLMSSKSSNNCLVPTSHKIRQMKNSEPYCKLKLDSLKQLYCPNFSAPLTANSITALKHFPLLKVSTQVPSNNFPFNDYYSNSLIQERSLCHADHKWQNSMWSCWNNESENNNKIAEFNNNNVSENKNYSNNNHNSYNDDKICPPSQTMTQPGNFNNEESEEDNDSASQPKIERSRSVAQTNLARKREKQEQQQQQQISSNEQQNHKRNDNDVVLLPTTTTKIIEEIAKNNARATAQQNCRLDGVVRGVQNSRSANLLCSQENMNDVQQQDQHQQQQTQMHALQQHTQEETITSNAKSGNVVIAKKRVKRVKRSPKSNDHTVEERVKEQISHEAMPLKIVKNIKLSADIGQQQLSTPSPTDTCSDVCDTSSQADLTRSVVECAIVRETCIANNNNGINNNEQRAPSSSSASTTAASSSLAITTTVADKAHASSTSVVSGLETRAPQHEQQPLIIEIGATHIVTVDVPEHNDDPQQSKSRARHTAMTLTKVEDQCDEENSSVSSSTYLDDKQSKQANVAQCVDEIMKYEMKSATKSAVTSPSTIAPMRPSLLQQTKSETRLSAHLASGDGHGSTSTSSLLAATDLSRLANFGKPRPRREGSGDTVTPRTLSSDAQDSVLPARTLLRRQRRLQTQHSEDKKEDPIERLNRLRARISSTLSEVKGVLQHYSVEESGESSAPSIIQSKSASTMGNIAKKNECDVQPQAKFIEDKPKEEGPVNFRFVRKVRRRSVFNDDEEDEKQQQENKVPEELMDIKKEKEENGSSTSVTSAKDKIDHEVKKKEEIKTIINNEKQVKMEKEIEHSTNVQVEKKSSTDQQQKLNITSIVKEDKIIENVEVIQKEKQNGNESENLEAILREQHDLNATEKFKNTEVEVKTMKTSTTQQLLVQQNYDERRASIAATEASRVVPPIETETPELLKIQRRPSDSEAVLKRKNFRAQINTKNKVETKACETEQIKVMPKAIKQNTQLKPNEASVRVVAATTVSPNSLATLREKKSSDESPTETVTEIRETQTQIETAAVVTPDAITQATQNNATEIAMKKPKKRSTLKAKEPAAAGVRRASVAAAEASQIEPPVKAATAIDIKSQRRPSDSEAVVKRKAATSEATSTNVDANGSANVVATPKVRAVTKVKRPSVKSNVSSGNLQPTTIACSAAALSGVANNSHKDAAQSTTAALTSIALPTQSAVITSAIAIEIDDVANKQIPVNETISTTKVTTNNIQSATKLDGQPDAMVATLTSPLRAIEASSSVDRALATASSVTVTAKELIELVNENIFVKPATYKTLQSEKLTTAATAKETEIPKENAAAAESSQQKNVSASENLINQEAAIPRITPQAKAFPPDVLQTSTVQQVSHSEAPPKHTESSLRESTYNKIADNSVTTTAVSATALETTKSNSATGDDNSRLTPITAATTLPEFESKLQSGIPIPTAVVTSTATGTVTETVTQTTDVMPELQVVPAPVKPLQVYTESEAAKDALISQSSVTLKEGVTKKKIIIKKVRKSSIDKAFEKKLSTSASEEITETTDDAANTDIADILHNEVAIEAADATNNTEVVNEEETTSAPAPAKKARKVKKKVIIRRQHRKLSISDAFFQAPAQLEKQPSEVETLEKAIAYVTDDEAEDETEKTDEPLKPLKTCIKQREYQIGDWVMYGERFRKTQIRWKKGRITERITSISYKIDIDGQEVSAHISYIKKYTGRKVNFGGKEYLEIDYEQIAEEERRARTYSIWNMV